MKGRSVDSPDIERFKSEFSQLIGSLDVISTLKDELELRLDEARDDCVREVLDNIIALVDAQGIEQRCRLDDLREHLQQVGLNEPAR